MPTIDSDALRTLATRLDSEVGGAVADALTALGKAQSIEYANFTNVHPALAAAYVEAWNFENRDLQRKRNVATEFRDRMTKTADDWDAAEQHNIIKQGG
ncbi:MAG TPA: type VII secretion target [Jatrophihabitans sp.]|nr:type VII secretion target [Jatrophihabitans sp.]